MSSERTGEVLCTMSQK